MASEKLDPIVPYLVGQFRRAVIVLDFGHQDERRDMEIAAIKSLNEALMMLDSYGEPGRLSLLPLLDDSESGARVYAAKYLMELVPDRALETLKDVAVRANTSSSQNMALGLLADHFERQAKLKKLQAP